jgi:hypothetical protein
MRHFIDIVTSPDLLLEAQRYEDMFSAIKTRIGQAIENGEPLNDDLPVTDEKNSVILFRIIEEEIKWAKSILKKMDRVVWFLRISRYHMVENMTAFVDLKKKYGGELSRQTGTPADNLFFPDNFKRSIEHFLSLPIHGIQNYQFEFQTPERILSDFAVIEKEWQEEREHSVRHRSEDKILIDFHDGWVWMHLQRPNCDEEGDAMGHCGNSPRSGTDDTILSLRKKIEGGLWKPYATFILHSSANHSEEGGYLGEMKGRFNEKPGRNEKPVIRDLIHKKIIALLKHPIVLGIRGGGYLPENNFSINDIDEDERNELIEQKPDLADAAHYLRLKGYDDVFEDKLAKELSQHLRVGVELINEKYCVVERWSDISDLVSALYFTSEHKDIESIKEIFDGDFDELPIEDIGALKKWMKEHKTIRAIIDAHFNGIEEFFDVKEDAMEAFLMAMRKKIETKCADYMFDFCSHLPFRANVYLRKLDDGQIEMRYTTEELAWGLSEIANYDGDGEFNDGWHLDGIRENGWTYTEDYYENFDEWVKNPTEVLNGIEPAIERILIKLVTRLCRSGSDQYKFDF